MNSRFDTLIKKGTLVLENGCKEGSIGILDGKIAAILENGIEVGADKIIDATGKYVLPGAIDTHTHFFEPGADYRENWECGSRAAAAGGYTCVMEMPNSNPAVTNEEAFRLKYLLAKQNSVVDFALWGGAVDNNLDQLEKLKELGCIAFKGFTCDAGSTYPFLQHQMQVEAMKKVNALEGIIGFHAEDNEIVGTLTRRNKESMQWNLKVHSETRPYYAELTAIVNAIVFSQATGCPVHICHLSIPEGAEAIRRAKREGIDITVESCPHYFLLNYEDNYDSNTYAKIQPPIRERDRMNRLWEYLLDGTIDYLGTDHAPYTKEDKEPKDGNLWGVDGGIPSIDVAIELMLTEAVQKRGMSIVDFSKLTSTNAAKRFGIFPRKGAIRIGSDADLAVINMEHRHKYTRKHTFSRSKSTKFPYEGRHLGCKVETTLVRGTVVYHEGESVVNPGNGQFIKSI